MVVVEYTYEDMKRLIDLPKDRMIAVLNELGAPSEYEEETKKIVTELTPNRPDWYSMEGLARSMRAYTRITHPKYKTEASDYQVIVDPSVKDVRPYTVCAVVKGLKFDDQRIQDMVLLQEKLLATLGRKVKKFGLGIYPLEALKFPVRYTTLKPKEVVYTPLGSEKSMNGEEILREHKKGQQYGYLLKGKDRYPVFMDAKSRIMALIPIVNSAETGKVDVSTKDIFVEVSGMDMNTCKAALNILVCTFADMGGAVYEVEMRYEHEKFPSPDLRLREIKLDVDKANRTLGLKLTEKEVASLLAKMGYGYKEKKALIQPYRADVMGWVDIMEDIAIAYGYNNFLPTTPDFFSPGKTDRRYDNIDETMRGMGFIEVKTFILTNEGALERTGYNGPLLKIENPGSADFTVVRPNLQAAMLETFSINKMKGLPQKIYEIGIVYGKSKEGKRLAFGYMDKKTDFSVMRGYLQTLAKEMGKELMLEKRLSAVFDDSTSCAVLLEGKEIGVLGKVKTEVLDRFGLTFEVQFCEIEV